MAQVIRLFLKIKAQNKTKPLDVTLNLSTTLSAVSGEKETLTSACIGVREKPDKIYKDHSSFGSTSTK